MPPLATDRLTENLHETNSRLSACLDQMVTDPTPGAPEALLAAPHRFAGLLSELMRAGEWIRSLPRQRDAQLEQELRRYRANVERLRDLLPAIHRALLAEKARLEEERARVHGAAEWFRGSQQTL